VSHEFQLHLIFFLVGAFASFFSTVAGFGGGIVLLALGAFLFDIKELIPIAAIFFWALSLVQFGSFRKELDRETAGIYIVSALPGVLLGMAVFYVVPGETIKMALAVVVLAYSAGAWLGWFDKRRPGRWASGGISLGAGFIDSITGSGGVIQAPLFLARGLRKEAFVATFAFTSVVVSPVKIGIYWGMGFFEPGNLSFVLVLAVSSILGVRLGKVILRRVSPETFKRVALLFLVLVAVRMLVL